MAMKKEPEVIVFEEPSYSRKASREAAKEKEMFLRGDVTEVFSSVQQRDSTVKTNAQPSSSEIDIKATLREVQSLAASSLTGKTRRKFEEEQMKALGAKPAKSDYVPYPHYQMVNKAKKEREKRFEDELGRAMGKKSRKRKARNGAVVKGKGRWKDSTKSLDPAVGKFKGGVLKLSRKTKIVDLIHSNIHKME